MRTLLILAMLIALAGHAAAQDSERVTLYFGGCQQPAYLFRGPTGDTILVQDSAAQRAVFAGQYDVLGHDRGMNGAKGIVAGGLAGFAGGLIWELSDGGSLWDVIDLFDDDDEKFGTWHEKEDFPWRVALGTLAGALVGGLFGALIPDNRHITLDPSGLVVRIGNGSGWVPDVVPAEASRSEPISPSE